MDLILIRHARAFDRDAAAWPDDSRRPLLAEGREEFVRLAKRLGRLVGSVDLLESSGFVRCWQTAQLLHDHAGWPKPSRLERLEVREHAAEEQGQVPVHGRGAGGWGGHGGGHDFGGLASRSPDPQLASLLRAVAALRGIDVVAWVGHEPTLSRFASLLLSGDAAKVPIAMKKGAALALRIRGEGEAPPRGELLWMLTPGVVARMRRTPRKGKTRQRRSPEP